MEDVTYDPEPVMVKASEVDASVQAMLDKEVGSSARAWDNKLLKRCVCWQGAGVDSRSALNRLLRSSC
jgi:hypothetical protein